jgi:hypothetical protein
VEDELHFLLAERHGSSTVDRHGCPRRFDVAQVDGGGCGVRNAR